MRNKLLMNVLLIALPILFVSYYLYGFDNSTRFNDRPLMGILTLTLSYLAAYLFIVLFFGKPDQMPTLRLLASISFSGSFIFSLYMLSPTVIKALRASPAIDLSGYYAPVLIVFFTISAIFFAVSAGVSIGIRGVIKYKEEFR